MPLGDAERRRWLTAIEAMTASVAEVLSGQTGTEHGREPLTVGAGGDRTAVVDRLAEDAVIAACERLAAQGTRFSLLSEELGERSYGAAAPRLVVDPVDGSLNAMFGVPYFSVSIALLDGGRLGDGAVGVVRNLAGPGVFSAATGAGARRDGRPLQPLAVGLDGGRIPMLLVEAYQHRTDSAERLLAPLLRSCRRVRILGSAALSLCMVAAGAASALVAPAGMRTFDCAAGLCILRESGATVTDLEGAPVEDRPATLTDRHPIVASRDPGVHRRVLDLLADGAARARRS